MFLKFLILVYVLAIGSSSSRASGDFGFTFTNGLQSRNLTLDGVAEITHNGLLALTGNGTKHQLGHAFYPDPIQFKNSSNGSVFSFSTTFVFAIISEYPTLSGHGMAFVVAPRKWFPGARPSKYLGLFNSSNDGSPDNHVVAVELDTIQNPDSNDISDNHLAIDINGLNSTVAEPAGYYAPNTTQFHNLSLFSHKETQVWVEYDGLKQQMNVTIAPINISCKPTKPLLSLSYDLSEIINQSSMYVGFSASTCTAVTSHYVLGWSFKMNGQAEQLDLSLLPKLPRTGPMKISKLLTTGLPFISLVSAFAVISGAVLYVRRKRKFAEVLEDWERDFGPQRFKFKDLYIATKGFRDKELLGIGGFGRVYKGVLPNSSKTEVAVKRISHDSRQGMKEFVAEIITIGRMGHRNIVQLLGYCRRKGELLLVYEYMPNGSLDKFLYNQPKLFLNWHQRFLVIKGVASGLFYLHEQWEQVVVHRDVKASNVLLDGELNGRLGDFGLARLHDHGTDPRTTSLVGTFGYLAPEHTRTGKATTSTDVYAFGAFLLEVACGRRPIETQAPKEAVILVDWVFSVWNRGNILQVVDPILGREYVAEEAELVLKLGLLCSHPEPGARPSMRQIVEYLEGDIPLPDLKLLEISITGLSSRHEGFDDFVISCPSSMGRAFSHSSVAESVLSGGR